MRAVAAVCGAACLLGALLFLCLGPPLTPAPDAPPPPLPLRNLPSYILTLDAAGSEPLARAVARHLTGARPRLWPALNGTQALNATAQQLPLYTRLALTAGRHDHMPIGTPEMLACLLGHMAIWRDIRARGWTEALVLEEDAFIDAASTRRMAQLRADAARQAYDLLLLEHGHLTVSGAERAVGVLARAWAVPDDARQNRWMGTRGYLVRASALPRLLRHAAPMDVQVDAVITLAVVFDGLRMLWTSLDVAQPASLLRMSSVQASDPCLKCFVSPDSARVLLGLFMALGLCVPMARWITTRASSSPPDSPRPPSTSSPKS